MAGNTSEGSKYSSCVPFGECEPCPESALMEPSCQPFGNRLLFHCMLDDMTQGEQPVWESCGRIVRQESRDFAEFVFCNLVIVTVALVVVFTRLKLLDLLRSRNLATRIGLYRR